MSDPREVVEARPALFQKGEFTLHSGGVSDFKIECDALTDDDLHALASIAAERFRWSYALGIGTGGSRFAQVLAAYNTKDYTTPRMIVDDVFTTGASMERERRMFKDYETFGLVIFARNPTPDWIYPMFTMWSSRD